MRNWGDALAHTGPNFGVFEDEPRATISSQAGAKMRRGVLRRISRSFQTCYA